MPNAEARVRVPRGRGASGAEVRRGEPSRGRGPWILVLLAVLAAWLLAPPLALAQERSIAGERYAVEIAVEPDGSLAIVERMTLAFRGEPGFTRVFTPIYL